MATTSSSLRRPAAVLVAVATVLVVALGALAYAQRGSSEPPHPGFWPSISVRASETFFPKDVREIARASDAIVVARVTDVTEGRELVPTEPEPPGPFGYPETVFVELTVSRGVSGPFQPGDTVRLEMLRPGQPFAIDSVRSRLPQEESLFFLWNNAQIAKRHGAPASQIPDADRTLWVPASSKGVIAEGASGLDEAMHADDDAVFLGSFRATTVRQAADRAAASLR